MTVVKSHGFFKFLAPFYDIEARIAMLGQYDRLRALLLGKIDTAPDRRILDLASGTGYLAEKLAATDLVCTDISIHMLKRARAKAAGNFVLADSHRLPFRDGVFDAAVSSFALHEFGRPKTVLEEMFRTIKPSGEIAVMDVVQQKMLSRKLLLQIYHTMIELRTATYMNVQDILDVFHAHGEFNTRREMFGLVALVWGRKKR